MKKWMFISYFLPCKAGLSLAQVMSSEQIGIDPWEPDDEIGALNLMTDQSRLKVLSRIRSGKVYDLSVEYFVGMPSFHSLGDPAYQFWMTHTPKGTLTDNPNGVYEFAFKGSSLKLRGASEAPMCTIAIPID